MSKHSNDQDSGMYKHVPIFRNPPPPPPMRDGRMSPEQANEVWAIAKNQQLQKELSDLKANLNRAYNGIEYYKKKWQDLLGIHSRLQKENEELKNKIEEHEKNS